MNQPSRSDRYDTAGNPEAEYVDPEQTVLVNLPGITTLAELQLAEEEALARAYESMLLQVRTDTPLTAGLLRRIHAEIFGSLFAWAGNWRTLQISKPGAIWPSAQYLDRSMVTFEHDVLNAFPAACLKDDDEFC